jgi:hypothetical protein
VKKHYQADFTQQDIYLDPSLKQIKKIAEENNQKFVL